ncbi:MBL fold metallo-hydrolase [Cardiobacteriaceae bacterium TAE3-ERU3]|nr:MBL fold metallo-hydrolase [Cardiobacteriaceae bacterium TAE3-ERU3]
MAFTLHAIAGYIETVYLAEYDDKLLLLDGACRCDVGKICAFIEDELQRPLSDLHAVVVTHMHPDHGGGAALLRKRTGCALWVAANANDLYAGFSGWLQHKIDLLLAYYMARKKRQPWRNIYYHRRLRGDVVLHDGDSLPDFPDWKVLHTPGHTMSDLSLWHEDSAQLYVADLIIKVRRGLISPFPITDPLAYRQSLARIRALPVRDYLLAHHDTLPADEVDWSLFSAQIPDQRRTIRELIRSKLRFRM